MNPTHGQPIVGKPPTPKKDFPPDTSTHLFSQSLLNLRTSSALGKIVRQKIQMLLASASNRLPKCFLISTNALVERNADLNIGLTNIGVNVVT